MLNVLLEKTLQMEPWIKIIFKMNSVKRIAFTIKTKKSVTDIVLRNDQKKLLNLTEG